MIWDELSKAALMGTDRYQLSEEVLAVLDKLGINTKEQAAQAVMEGAAIYYNIQRAGFPLEQMENIVEVPKFNTGKRLANGVIARYFQLILSGRYLKVLPEILELCREHNIQLPAEQLPKFFDLSLGRPPFWQSLQPLLEERERWLLRQNPEWSSLADLPSDEGTSVVTVEEQAAMLRYLRRATPEKAAAFLEPYWQELAYQEKRLLLQQFVIGLGKHDEPFLQNCREDNRKEVRSAAAELLIDIPDTALQTELLEQGAAIIEIVQGSLKIHLPNPKHLPKGISTQKSKFKGSKQAVAAYTIIARIPPRNWESHFNRPIVDCLRMMGRSQEKRLLIHGVAQAALRFQDLRWVEAILRYWWRLDDTPNWSSTLGKNLMTALPKPVFNEIVVQHFHQETGLVEEDSFIGQLIGIGTHHWENRVAALIINGFQQWANTSQSYYWNVWHYKRILKVAAYRVDPQLLDSFQQGWNPRSPVWPRWEGDVERMLKTLAFRKDVHKAFRAYVE